MSKHQKFRSSFPVDPSQTEEAVVISADEWRTFYREQTNLRTEI